MTRSVDASEPDVSISGRSTIHRARRILAIRPFRRLWFITYLCSTADWLALLAVTSFATKLTDNYTVQNLAFSAVVLTNLLPGLIFAPVGGLLADRFDRRKIMIICDMGRFILLVSMALAGSAWWLFAGNILVGCCAAMWIPSKDAALPNLLRRPDQVETANQLGLVMTYGIAVVSGGGILTFLYGMETLFHISPDVFGELGLAKVALALNGVLYLSSAVLTLRIPELSLRSNLPAISLEFQRGPTAGSNEKPSFWSMISDSVKFVRREPLIRGLLIGMTGAFAAGGIVIGSLKPYSSSLMGGDASFSLLFIFAFIGAGIGMTAAPKVTHRIPRDRLFGIAIITAGFFLIIASMSPHLAVSLLTVMAIGASAGAAFLTGVTIIGTSVDDAHRGRVNALYQALMKTVLFGATAVTPLPIGLLQPQTIMVLGRQTTVDGTRPVLFAGAVLAIVLGVVAYRRMDSRRARPIIADLRALVNHKASEDGLLIAFEGRDPYAVNLQADRLAEYMRSRGCHTLLATENQTDVDLTVIPLLDMPLHSVRARSLLTAALRADLLERQVKPALARGEVVIMPNFHDSPHASIAAQAGLETDEIDDLTGWTTAGLLPNFTIVLDSECAPNSDVHSEESMHGRWDAWHMIGDIAATRPDKFAAIDTENATAAEIHERVIANLPAPLKAKIDLY
ncbi:MFS transporter [Kibdelosporangium philippinense]|uniref:MFS transporter n=1 Tax=Kibdelosporangium philippinense TaxID=211113 RepID=A0ABS8ZI52_9PSEU|nr:MFS transporter [Kibdelosporangium philippinense]MCE7007059.1 MFS transporter [Kibdelosporangium philippinense]